jgi:hypothetical protein
MRIEGFQSVYTDAKREGRALPGSTKGDFPKSAEQCPAFQASVHRILLVLVVVLVLELPPKKPRTRTRTTTRRIAKTRFSDVLQGESRFSG